MFLKDSMADLTLHPLPTSDDKQVSPSTLAKLVNALTLIVVVLSVTWKFSLPLRSHQPLMGFAQDDFYYYLKAAQNLAAGHGSTFDGSTLTNGYHPLYFLLWTCASFFVHSLRGVFRLLWLLDVTSATAIFLAVRGIFRRVTADAVLSNAGAIAVLLPCVATISFQMETTLALPLGFAFLGVGFVPPERYTAGRCALLGLLGALTMLARLDAGILVCIFLLALLAVRPMRVVLTPRNMACFSLSALPLLAIYFALNHHYFHEWLPISGSAKQLRHGWKPDVSQLQLSFAGFTLIFLAIAAVGFLLFLMLRRWLAPEEKVLCAAAFLMPAVFYTIEIFVSAWKLWGWYLYAVRFSLMATVLLLLVALCRREVAHAAALHRLASGAWFGRLALLVALAALLSVHYKVDKVMPVIASEGVALNSFAQAHPGKYAMGDRAGMFGYLSSSPLIQTEGLMMDRQYLEHIRHEDDLLTTLRHYDVNYYVQYVFDQDAAERFHGSCLYAQEPSIAGKDALRMRSLLCSAPEAILPSDGGKAYIYHLSAR